MKVAIALVILTFLQIAVDSVSAQTRCTSTRVGNTTYTTCY